MGNAAYQQVRPSFANGWARSAAESEHPELWQGPGYRLVHLTDTRLGPTGNTLVDLVSRLEGTFTTEATDLPLWGEHEPGQVLTYSQGGSSGSGATVRFPVGDPTLGAATLGGPISVLAFARPTSVAAGTIQILSFANSGGNQNFTLEINRTAARLSTVWSNVVIATGGTNIVNNTWNWFGLTRTGVTGTRGVKLFLNGELDHSGTTLASGNATTASALLSIGGIPNVYPDYIQHWSGQIAVTAVYEGDIPDELHYQWSAGANPLVRRRRVYRAAPAGGGGGRTTRNTRAWPLGMEIGMNWVSGAQV